MIYTTISRTPKFYPSVFVNSIRREAPKTLSWPQVVAQFDQERLRISSGQFLAIYQALRPLAESKDEDTLDIQRLWGGRWQNTETQLSFIGAFASLGPEELDASTIPHLSRTFTLDEYSGAAENIQERAAYAIKHPLASVAALSAIFNVALQSPSVSGTPEAKRLFQNVVIPNLDIFLVSAFGVPKPWPEFTFETFNKLFDRFLYKMDPNYDFVLYSIWRKDRNWVVLRLIEIHAKSPLELPVILEHAVRLHWLDELVLLINGFGLDLAALAHARGFLDLERWQHMHSQHSHDLAQMLLNFLSVKAEHELTYQRTQQQELLSVMLPVKTVSALLNIWTGIGYQNHRVNAMIVQRNCITAYPRLINYGEGFDEIIDANGQERNSLPKEANDKMEGHYKRMYSGDIKVIAIIEALRGYKHSRDPADQDVFACMIHGLFDEYSLYHTYPLDALKITALLFGGIIRHKLLPLLPLEIGLGMILDAVKDHTIEQPMYKFGLEALKQTFELFEEWPGFCRLLVQVSSLRGTDAWEKAEEVIRSQEAERARNGNGNGALQNEGANGDVLENGNFDGMLSNEPSAPPFTSVNVDLSGYSNVYEDPSGETQEKVLFVLNNITETNLESKFKELKDVIEDKYQQWFAGHLVEERAKMQPNYHQLYLDLIKSFENKSLWAEVLRETYVSVIRMLNAESTMQSSSERTHLKNLGGWLGSLTLARDKPIKHRNMAFKQLLMEAFDTQRLIVVIPFVCKVLIQGASSTVFKPPNPWLMDIIHLLIELYHHAELKLNLKFEIEVLCKGLSLDHKSIEPSTDIQARLPPVDESSEPPALDVVDRFDTLSLNGMVGGVSSGRFSPEEIISSLPDLGPLLQYPPPNDLVPHSRLQEIVKVAITRAVHSIIAPVVERSVTIAAISTAQMIHKDFSTEPDENRVRSAAINMVKRTAGSLALVTSKEPLRASMSNYIRSLAQEILQLQGLPEGTIIMCVNSNLDMACSLVEKKAEERAVPEIEDMIEQELEARRRHRATRPNEPYVDPGLSRWALTIPNPFKLMPGTLGGLNQEQIAIYDEFARQPRVATMGISAHGPSSSDATRSMANDILQDQYPTVPTLPSQPENPAMPHLSNQQPTYTQPATQINGRLPAPQVVDPRAFAEKIALLLGELITSASNALEQHYLELPRPHPVLDVVDALISLIIRYSQISEDASRYTAEQICEILFSPQVDDDLAIESLVHVLENLCKITEKTARRVVMLIALQPDERLLSSVPLAISLVQSDVPLLDWQRIDVAVSKAIQQRSLPALDFLSLVTDRVLFIRDKVALYSDFIRSWKAVGAWLKEEPSLEIGQLLFQKCKFAGLPHSVNLEGNELLKARKLQIEYMFEEWLHLYNNPNAPEQAAFAFTRQFQQKQYVDNVEHSLAFYRVCVDQAVEHFDQQQQQNKGSFEDCYIPADGLANLVVNLVKYNSRAPVEARPAQLEGILSLFILILNHHHVIHGEHFCQKVFFRLFSTMLCEFSLVADQFTETERLRIYLAFAAAFIKMQPYHFPGFFFGWLALISHRNFLPHVLRLPDRHGWSEALELIEGLLLYIGDILKPLQHSPTVTSIYKGVVKFLLVLYKDEPEFLASNHVRLCAAIPTTCVQLRNLILSANPAPFPKIPDALQVGLKADRIDGMRDSPSIPLSTVELPLQHAGLVEVLDQALKNGPSEDAVAHIAHGIQRRDGHETTVGFVPVTVNAKLIDAIVLYVGMHAIAKATQKGGPTFIQASPDAVLLKMLVHELNPEARYYLISSIINQLRYANAHTHYFGQALLEIFGHDMNDQEESDIRQQITRVLFERLNSSWPQPWGIILTVVELVKNEKYMFFDLPFVKANPEARLSYNHLLFTN